MTTAENGGAGLEAVSAGKPGLVLLDLMMPELDGFGFLRELRARSDWRDIPVVVLTAKDVTAARRQGRPNPAEGQPQHGGPHRYPARSHGSGPARG
ncbi:response regulator [Methylobacterium oryzae]|uniref:response regulator n=1 Tax=Methylobacterium oryzae TaxID=334852 RepID=UPI002DD43504|nr:response regulator [Methylobacterium oryzae]